MLIRGIQEEDFTNYKKTSMFVIFPSCTFKCDREAGCTVCQNSDLVKKVKAIDVDAETIVDHYIANGITHAIVFGGLEPFDSFDDLVNLVKKLRSKTDDDIVIYTGYTEDEIIDKINALKSFTNIIVKFGRFRYNAPHRFDNVLGIELASNNQYAKRIS